MTTYQMGTAGVGIDRSDGTWLKKLGLQGRTYAHGSQAELLHGAEAAPGLDSRCPRHSEHPDCVQWPRPRQQQMCRLASCRLVLEESPAATILVMLRLDDRVSGAKVEVLRGPCEAHSHLEFLTLANH